MNVWIAVRTDNVAGSGTQSDPFDGHTQAQFDAIMNALPMQVLSITNSANAATVTAVNHGYGYGRRILFIVNPAAGADQGRQKWAALKNLFKRDQVDFKEAFSERSGHAFELARDSAPNYDVLVAVGGDGTVREVVDGIMSAPRARAALGIVPFGTGNDVAEVLGIRTELEATRALKAGVIKSIDLIEIACQAGGQGVVRHALLFAGVGVIAEALRKTSPSFKRLFGQRLAYPMGLVAALLNYRAPCMRVTFDGTMLEEDFLFVGASNTETAGGGMRVAPGALIDDGVLNVNLISAMGRWRALWQLRRLSRGRHLGHPRMRYLTARTLQIEANPPLDVAADGDLIGHTPAQITVKPEALRVLVTPG